MKRHFQCGADPSMIRAQSEHETVSPQPASHPRLLFELTTHICYCKIQHSAPNLTFKPSPSAAPATKRDTRSTPNTAPATKSHTGTSPSTAPVTQKGSHAETSSHMKPHLQCAEQQVSPSNLRKYCACHKKLHCKISEQMSET